MEKLVKETITTFIKTYLCWKEFIELERGLQLVYLSAIAVESRLLALLASQRRRPAYRDGPKGLLRLKGDPNVTTAF